MGIQEMHYTFDLALDKVTTHDRAFFQPWEKDAFLNQAIMLYINSVYNADLYTAQGKVPEHGGFEANQLRIEQLSTLHIQSPVVQPEITPVNEINGLYEFNLNSLGNFYSSDGVLQKFRYMYATRIVILAQKENCPVRLIRLKPLQTDDVKTKYNCANWNFRQVIGSFGKSSTGIPVASSNTAMSDDFTMQLSGGTGTGRYDRSDELISLYADATDKYGNKEFNIVGAQISYLKYPNRVCLGTYSHIDRHASNVPIDCDINPAFHHQIVTMAVELAVKSLKDTIATQLQKDTAQGFDVY